MALRSFEAKVNLAVYIALALFIPVIGFAAYSIHYIVSEQRELIQAHGAQVILAERLRSEVKTQFALMPAFVLEGAQELVPHIKASQIRIREVLQQHLSIDREDADLELLRRIQSQEEELYTLGKPLIEKRLRGQSAEDVNREMGSQARILGSSLDHLLDRLVEKETADLARTKHEVYSAVSNLLTTLGIFTLFCLAFSGAIAVLVTKITKQKRQLDMETEARLREQEKHARARKEILEVVSHDLKNPLSTMKMATEILEEEFELHQEHCGDFREPIEIAKRSIHSMDRLIRDLLDNAKIESGGMSLELSATRLHTLTSQLSDPLKPLAKAKGIELVTTFENDDPTVACDRDRVGQVFSNLLGNAIKFTPENGKIWIHAEKRKNEAMISIRDTGSGIPKEQLPHIFDRFWQVRETAAQGTGLGLAIVKGIIEAHGTKIWAESEVGRGTEFHFTLPLQSQNVSQSMH